MLQLVLKRSTEPCLFQLVGWKVPHVPLGCVGGSGNRFFLDEVTRKKNECRAPSKQPLSQDGASSSCHVRGCAVHGLV